MKQKVETKVKASSGTALVAAFVVALIVHQLPFLAGTSELLQDTIVGVLAGGAAFGAGWAAKHTPRLPAAADRTTGRPYGG